MAESPIRAYLRALRGELRRFGLPPDEILEEIEGHLREAAQNERQRGLAEEDSELAALGRFGPARQVAQQFEKERNYPMQKVFLGLALAAGLFIAYVDSRPTWDDTGITVFALLLAGGILGLLAKRRPWLFALALGVWLPLWEGVLHHNPALLVTLIFPFAGVYAGWAVRWGIQKTLHPV